MHFSHVLLLALPFGGVLANPSGPRNVKPIEPSYETLNEIIAAGSTPQVKRSLLPVEDAVAGMSEARSEENGLAKREIAGCHTSSSALNIHSPLVRTNL